MFSSLNGMSDILCRHHLDFSFINMKISSLIKLVTNNSISLSSSSFKIDIFYVESTLISSPRMPVILQGPFFSYFFVVCQMCYMRFTSVAPVVNLVILLMPLVNCLVCVIFVALCFLFYLTL